MARSVYSRYGTSTITGTTQNERKHTFVIGNTLSSIAAYWAPDLGYSSEYWREIAEANGIDDLDSIPSGTVLSIPFPLPAST